jgi:hypothetical protein
MRYIVFLKSEIIGPMPQIAPKKHCAPRCGKVERGAAEDR